MPVTNYYTIDGEIIGEATSGVLLTKVEKCTTATLGQGWLRLVEVHALQAYKVVRRAVIRGGRSIRAVARGINRRTVK